MDIKYETIRSIEKVTKKESINEIAQTGDFKRLNLSSINFIKLILELENRFEIEFDNNDLEYANYDTFQKLYDYIEMKLKQKI